MNLAGGSLWDSWEDRTAALLFGAKRFMILNVLTPVNLLNPEDATH
jgi:hypothetical protein